MTYILTSYINTALSNALYDKLDDGSLQGAFPLARDIKTIVEPI
ncbi:MAG: hypothetical protein ACOVSW_13175 [Candidatus Kapaibacteriota bacterium]